MMIKARLDGSCCYDFHRGISNQEVPSGHAAPGRKEIVQAHGHPQTKLDDNIFGEYSRWGLSQLLQLPVMCARIPERYDCTLAASFKKRQEDPPMWPGHQSQRCKVSPSLLPALESVHQGAPFKENQGHC